MLPNGGLSRRRVLVAIGIAIFVGLRFIPPTPKRENNETTLEGFDPVDHKDSSPKYRERVWRGVAEEILKENIVPISSSQQVEGLWDIRGAGSGVRLYFKEFSLPNTVRSHLERQSSTAEFEVGTGRITMNWETYHCALTASGTLVIFNGDASLCLVGTRCESVIW